jgi:beta-phosphoglucomutase-like phosphatase (HAD superfamily)
MSELRAIIFDFDGVIADTEPLHFAALRQVLAGIDISLTEAEYYTDYLGSTIAAASWRPCSPTSARPLPHS